MDLSETPLMSEKGLYLPIRTESTDSQDLESQDGEILLPSVNCGRQPFNHGRRPKQKMHRYAQVASRIILLALAGWGLLSLCLQVASSLGQVPSSTISSALSTTPSPYFYDVYRPSTHPPGLNLCECGTTAVSAGERGCVYDAMAAAWLPPHCRDTELTFKFERSGPKADGGRWSYFADRNGSVPLTTADIGQLAFSNGTFWATHRWHVAHCMFYWEKYWRMRITGIVMEKKFDTLTHVEHCRHLVLGPQPADDSTLLEVTVSMNGELEYVQRTGEPQGHHDG